MPRKGAEKRWEKDMKPLDEWYAEKDPWKVRTDPDEWKKAKEIEKHLYDRYGTGIDLGCGEGIFTSIYAKRCGKMFGCDISKVAIERAKSYFPSIEFFQCDITKPIRKNLKFDLVMCNEVLYYLKPEDCKKVAKNVYRLLKPGGHLVVSLSHYYLLAELYDMFKEIDWNTMTNFDYKDDYTIIIGGRYVPKKKV
jgi:SAM-dependent methyltransferase